MPYIKKQLRQALDTGEYTHTPGELNYVFTRNIIAYLEVNGGVNYQNINNVIGALEGAKLEFYRRVAAPYEDQKIKENGDVY